MIRVLVADDSITARELLVETLRSDPEIRVVGEAGDGDEAVRMTKSLRPNVVTMDVRMPRLNGLEATRRIMAEAPTPVVIISGHFDVRQNQAFMDALLLGALWVLERLPGPRSPAFQDAARRLVAMVKAMAQVKVVHQWTPRPAAAPESASRRPGTARGVRASILAVAASTGGPAALAHILSQLPRDFPAAILVVQHMAPGFIAGLAQSLARTTRLRVKLAEDREAIRPGIVYLAPDDHHLGVTGPSTLLLSNSPPVGGLRPSASFLFHSVGEAFGTAGLAVVLSGMGDDGMDGLRALRKAGGRVIVQDEASSVVFGMPGAAVAAGLADSVLPLLAIPAQLVEAV
ncbi:MAG: chemotaxis-specific protein-glutamate methyltransferase CheB [Planctomycetes bacterium]|nr:chemotaxis-specific protein-glutamate methyltransferase CheB [Planctomycetota bacterium]